MQEHIETIQNRWLSIDRIAAATTANMLEDVIHSIFGDPARISYELLQNADDASSSEGLNVDVEFTLLNHHLIVQHNGQHFSHQDVEGICRYGAISIPRANEEESKQFDLKKIGYKGIGFKSVFNLADRVWVCSGPYKFKFDKQHWKDLGRHLPWQITPIPFKETELAEQVQKFLKPKWVSFILDLKSNDREKVKRPIATLFNKEEVILFLRHIRSVKMLVQARDGREIVPYRQLTREQNGPVFKLKRWEKGELKEESNWYISHFSFHVPPEIRASLQPLNKRECPEKLKTATETEISFGAKLRRDNSVIRLSRPFIFSFLPTKKRYEFPFVVNGNFLMNEARTELLNTLWNEFLFEKIGYHQLKWFEQMAGDERFKYEFASLLVKYADSNRERRNQSLNKGVLEASKEVAFVPVLEATDLRLALETIVDQTGASVDLGDQDLVQGSFQESRSIADPGIKEIDNLIQIGAEQFDKEKLRDAIRQTNRYRNPEDNIRLINFFFNRITGIKNGNDQNAWKRILQETPFLLDTEEALACPNELYFPADIPKLPFELSMRFLHLIVYQDHINGENRLEEWLSQLGLAFPKPVEIIRRGVFSLIEEDKITASICIPLTRYVFKYYQQLEEKDFHILNNLPILTTQHSLRKVSTSYLSDEYEPKLSLAHLLDEDIFISPDYLRNEDEAVAWNRFWSKLGGRQEMEIELHKIRSPYNGLSHDYPDYHAFLEPHLPDFNRNARHDLVNFVIPRYINYCSRYEFALQYWEIILTDKWQDVRRKCNLCTFRHSHGKTIIPSYFEYIVRNRPYFPAKDGQCYPSIEVFSQDIAELLGGMRPVSALPVTKEQEDFWGIQNELDLATCLEILSDISMEEDTLDKQLITNLYQYMVESRFDQYEFETKRISIDGLKLLAANNTFQPISDLYYLAVPGFAQKVDSADFVFLNIPEEEALQLCTNFGIATLGVEDLSLADEKSNTDNMLRSKWTNRIPLLSALICQRTGRDPSEEKQRLDELTEKTTFQAAEKISLKLERDGRLLYQKSVRAWEKQQVIFFIHLWNDYRTLFELNTILAEYFGLEEIERELSLLLTLPIQEGVSWLKEQGLEIELDVQREENSSNVVEVPVANAKEAISVVVTQEPRNGNSAITTEAAEEIGKWGEEYISEKGEIAKYYEENQIPIKEVIWMNKEGESGKPYDFSVTLDHGDQEYWEIKSTPSSKKSEFPISENELLFAFQKREKYYLLRLLNAGKENPSIKIYPDAAAHVEAGDFIIREAILKII
jgi:hypothetical protein